MFGEIFFYIIGIYAFLWWFIDTFESLFRILWNVVMRYLQPDLYPELSEQFGNWAGDESKLVCCEHIRGHQKASSIERISISFCFTNHRIIRFILVANHTFYFELNSKTPIKYL